MQHQHEYRPLLKNEVIHVPTIIGAVTDCSPFHRLIESKVFSFYVGFNQHEIPAKYITQYTMSSEINKLDVVGEITYKDKRYGVRQIIDLYWKSDEVDFVTHRLFDILNEMKYKLKHEMYLLSNYKEQCDIIYNNLMNNLHNVDGRPELNEFLQEELNNLDYKMNKEFERTFMIGHGGTAQLNNSLFDEQMMNKHKENNGRTAFMDGKEYRVIETDADKKARLEKERLAEEEEYNRISDYISNGASTLRLNRKTIKQLTKDKTNKFVLPLEAAKVEDIDKFIHLTKQPFSFLTYNNAMFSVNLTTGAKTMWNEERDESEWLELVNQGVNGSKFVKEKIKAKKDAIIDRQERIEEAFDTLTEQITYLKKQFEKKASKFGSSSYIKFIATRTANNIKTVREAETHAARQLEVLKNKKLTSNPIAFFERAVTLFLGKTGEDIIHDLYELGFTSRDDHNIAIRYLYYMMNVVGKRDDEYISPIVAIMDKDEFNIGFKKSDILRVIAGHMFVHTVTIVKDYREPESIKVKPPEMRTVSEFGIGSTGPR